MTTDDTQGAKGSGCNSRRDRRLSCSLCAGIVGVQGSYDGYVHVRPTLLAHRSHLGRNPLLRRTDRIEALVMLVALVVSLVAIPVAAAVGIGVYDLRDSRFAQEGRDRHTEVAAVLETETEGARSTVVRARWPAAAGERTGVLQLTTQAKVGDRIEVWVDKDSNPVAPPTPTWHAVGDAYGATMATLLFVAVTMTSFVTGVCSRLDRERNAQWSVSSGAWKKTAPNEPALMIVGPEVMGLCLYAAHAYGRMIRR